MAQQPIIAPCHLCNEKRKLQRGHIWPRFVYKEIVADRLKGGAFFDLQLGKTNNRHETRYWFCTECEKRFQENYAAELLVRINKSPESDHAYSDELLTFCTSQSWRIAKYYEPKSASQHYRDLLTISGRRWKSFLRGECRHVRPFSQHVFISADETLCHHYVGAYPFAEEQLLIIRLGPLLIVALLGRKHLSTHERRRWERSEVQPSREGVILRLHRGKILPHLPTGLSEALNTMEQSLIDMHSVAHRREVLRKLK